MIDTSTLIIRQRIATKAACILAKRFFYQLEKLVLLTDIGLGQ